ncbi:flavin-containing monooxygenase [Pseudonocardia oroxyli]|uniref:Cyclohexanone monooxygenase n=1 Tax=Pseudonocardia oroxyli TaxID=366584 RepID=A0A1G7R2E8_PSEOR|nr:NAD(P)/FAD-dependent oxidoreductase [Pseudonocardia oroxyli]SDG04907.1 cyclohexanone monooxygenase [Pseudonocardia oroxyli]
MTDYDCIIIGAGFGGLRAMIEMRRRGLTARVIESGSDVGGTWYWNRYPGARTDSESWVYCFSFDDDLLQDWDWKARYPDQPEVQRYLAHVADRFDLRREIDFDTRVECAVRDDATNSWTVSTSSGNQLTCTYLIPATGPLSVPYLPPFPGIESFRGEWHLTARWPKESVDLTGKRVAVVGTGATAVQLIPEAAQLADHVTVFQRTPNYVIPARNGMLGDNQRRSIKAHYGDIWKQVGEHVFGMAINAAGRVLADVDGAEARRILERGWEVGGFRFLFESFDDVFTNQETNDVVSEFVRDKIRSIVVDPTTAELLCPKGYPVGGKRPPLGHHYYETFNRPNVSLVDVSGNPIESVTEAGIRLADGSEREFDMIVFATGFDAVTGGLTTIDIRSSAGVSLAEAWADGSETQLGIGVTGFPNMFMIGGPGSPIGNFPPAQDVAVPWIADAIEHLRATGADAMEADQSAMQAFGRHLRDMIDATVFGQGDELRSFLIGANVPGKPHVPLFHFGGFPAYCKELQDCADAGYVGFTIKAAPVRAHV